MALIGKIIAMTGVANIVDDKGSSRTAVPGDQIETGDSIQTAAGVTVDVQLANGRVVHIGADQLVAFTPELSEVFTPTEVENSIDVATIDSVIEAIESGQDINEVLEATAAGGAAGGSDGSHSAVFLDRITQFLTPLASQRAAVVNEEISPEVSNGNFNPGLFVPAAAEVAADAPVIVTNVQPGAGPLNPTTGAGTEGAVVVEGDDLLFSVTLNTAPTADTPVTLTITDGTAIVGTDTGTDFEVSFDGGTTFVPVNGTTVIVPAGSADFIVKVPTVVDALDEPLEEINFTAATENNVAADTPAPVQGGIVDAVIVETVQAGTGDLNPTTGAGSEGAVVQEGDDLLFEVTLNAAPIADTEVTLTFADGTGTVGTDTTTDYEVSFDGGVTFVPVTGTTVTVPAGADNFVVKVPTVVDALDEDAETITFTAATSSNVDANTPAPVTGTIVDAVIVETVQAGTGDLNPTTGAGSEGAVVEEGDDLLFEVTLNAAPIADTEVTLTFADGTGTVGTDTTTDYEVSFDGGVTFVPVTGTTVTVPAGADNFVVKVPTVVDALDEDAETITFTAATSSNVDANTPAPVTGTIVDAVIVETVQAGTGDLNPTTGAGSEGAVVEEGDDLLFEVTLNAAPIADTEVTLTFADGTGTVGTDTTTDYEVSFDGGVTFVPVTGTTVTVPAGADNFVVKVPTVVDALDEDAETITFTAATSSNVDANTPAPVTGTIVDAVIVETVQAGTGDLNPTTGAGSEGAVVEEGDDLLFEVTLNAAPIADTEVTLTFADGTGTVGTDTTTDYEVSFDGGVTFVPVTGTTVTVPAGADNFVVKVPTVVDALDEDAETITFTAATSSNVDANTPAPVTGTIVDAVIVETVQAGTGDLNPTTGAGSEGAVVEEGDDLLFEVTLNAAPIADTEVTLTFADGTGTVGTDTTTDYEVSFDGGVTFVPVTGTTVTVPAGADNFVVKVPTVVDALDEDAETITFTAATSSNVDANTPAPVTGTIVDAVIVETVQAGTGDLNPTTGAGTEGAVVEEGDDLLFEVTLNAAPISDTVVTLAFEDETAVIGVDTSTAYEVSFDGGVAYVPTGVNVTVPAGAQNFIVKVPTNLDFELESTESILFTATTENNVDANTPAQVKGFILDAVVENALGLSGEYFGYNDFAVPETELATVFKFIGDDSTTFSTSNIRSHSDDNPIVESDVTKLVNDPVNNRPADNLNSISDVQNIIDGRNGSGVVGTSTGTNEGVADVTFRATSLDYGANSSVADDNLGKNVTQAAGEALSADSNLAKFIAGGAHSATVQDGGDNDSATGIGLTTDAIIRLTGSVFLERGNYDFRVTADDGFRFRVGGETLIEFDGNQSPTTREYTNLNIEGAQSGLTDIEILYWEQGISAVLKVEYKLSSDSDYKLFSTDNLAMFGESDLTLSDSQELVYNASTSQWVVQSGETTTGTDGDDQLTGSANKDILSGLLGADVIQGLAGADVLNGGGGDDRLEGGLGNDDLVGGTGNDTMLGGEGDDVYRVDSAGDIFTEDAGNGTDTIEFEAAYDGDVNFTVADNFENVNLNDSGVLNVTGNAANNRIVGSDADNTIDGGAGNDRIIGGEGNDTVTGGAGNDIYTWRNGDQNDTGTAPVDRITDFTLNAAGTGQIKNANPSIDALDLRDLLQGETSTLVDDNKFTQDIDVGNLLNYLSFNVDSGNTTISVSSKGDGNVDQTIILDGVDLYADTGAGSEIALLQNLLANGSLIVD